MLQVKVADSPFKVLFQILYSNDVRLHLLGSCSTNGGIKVILNKSYQMLLILDVKRYFHDQIYLGKFIF